MICFTTIDPGEPLETVLIEYPVVSKENFKGHQFSIYFRNIIPQSTEKSLALPDIYNIRTSAGNEVWAKISWIEIFNKLVTETVTSGFLLCLPVPN